MIIVFRTPISLDILMRLVGLTISWHNGKTSVLVYIWHQLWSGWISCSPILTDMADPIVGRQTKCNGSPATWWRNDVKCWKCLQKGDWKARSTLQTGEMGVMQNQIHTTFKQREHLEQELVHLDRTKVWQAGGLDGMNTCKYVENGTVDAWHVCSSAQELGSLDLYKKRHVFRKRQWVL